MEKPRERIRRIASISDGGKADESQAHLPGGVEDAFEGSFHKKILFIVFAYIEHYNKENLSLAMSLVTYPYV